MRLKGVSAPTVYLDAVEVTALYKAAPKALSFDRGTPECLDTIVRLSEPCRTAMAPLSRASLAPPLLTPQVG